MYNISMKKAKTLYLDDNIVEKGKQLAEDSGGLSLSAYISYLIVEAYKNANRTKKN